MKVKFWGVRGSIAAPGMDTARYGGNTTCIEVRTDEGHIIILDGGTGIRPLGLELLKALPVKANIFISHTHWDHIKGVDELLQIADNDIIIRCHIFEQKRGFSHPDVHWWKHAECTSVSQDFGALNFAIYCTPGHSPGHVVFIVDGAVISGDCLFLGSCGRTDLNGGSKYKQRISLLYLRDILRNLPQDNLVLPGHQYELSDGSNPTVLNLVDFMAKNEALKSIDNEKDWNNLPFLSFDDNLAEKARRQRAQNS